jgi:hypothetical protein
MDQISAEQLLPLYAFINKKMRGRKVIIVVTKMDMLKDKPEIAIPKMIQTIRGYLLPALRENSTICMASCFEVNELLKLKRFLDANPSLNGKELRKEIKPIMKQLPKIKKIMGEDRDALSAHIEFLLNKTKNLTELLTDLCQNGEKYAYLSHCALLCEIIDRAKEQAQKLEGTCAK